MPEGDLDRVNSKKILYYICETTLRLYYPLAPFISEELWQRLTNNGSITIGLQSFPKAYYQFEHVESFEKLLDLSAFVDKFINCYGNIKNGELIIKIQEHSDLFDMVHENSKIILDLNKKLSTVLLADYKSQIMNSTDYVSKRYNDLIIVFLLVKGTLDITKEIERNESKLTKLIKKRETIENLQHGKDYATKSSRELQKRHANELQTYAYDISSIEGVVESLRGIKL